MPAAGAAAGRRRRTVAARPATGAQARTAPLAGRVRYAFAAPASIAFASLAFSRAAVLSMATM
jgi:hypothetical protein